MAKAMYTGVSNVSRKVRNQYEGVNGVARKVKSGFIGVSNVARQFFVGSPYAFNFLYSGAQNIIAHSYYHGYQNGEWRLYLDSEGSSNNDIGNCYIQIAGDLSGKTFSLACRCSIKTNNNSIVSMIYRKSGQWINDNPILTFNKSTEYQSLGGLIPVGADAIRFQIRHTTSGRYQTEFLIKRFSIDGVELV